MVEGVGIEDWEEKGVDAAERLDVFFRGETDGCLLWKERGWLVVLRGR